MSLARERSEEGTLRPSAFSGLEVDHQFEFGRALHWQVGGLLALEDAIDIASGLPVRINRSQVRKKSGHHQQRRRGMGRLLAIGVALRER